MPAEARGYSRRATSRDAERSGTKSDAFSGYSSGKSERAASSRGAEQPQQLAQSAAAAAAGAGDEARP